jgi:hypothetical protein
VILPETPHGHENQAEETRTEASRSETEIFRELGETRAKEGGSCGSLARHPLPDHGKTL